MNRFLTIWCRALSGCALSGPAQPGLTPTAGTTMRKDRRGGVAMMFALTALPLVAIVGLSIDLGFTIMAKARMDLAADSAALSAAKTTANAFANGATNYIQQGQTAGLAWFNGQAGTTGGLNMGTPVLTINQNGGVFTATLNYSGTMATNIATFFGFPNFPVQGSTTSTITVGGYADINILMDLSSSMGIAATQAGINTLGPLALAYNSGMAQNQSCAFGCHWDPNFNDFYGLARQNGISLRVDVLISAVQSVVSQLINQDVGSLYRVGLYSFNEAFQTIYPVSSNLSGAYTASQNVSVQLCCGGVNNDNLEPDTNFPLAMQSMTTAVGVSANGANAASPRKFVFLITDGISDYINSSGSRIQGNMTSDQCAGLKANGVTVLVLYTVYPDLSPNSYYMSTMLNNGVAAAIPTDLQACATAPEYYFQATDSTSIQAEMQQMLQIATATQARFTH